MNQYPSLIKAIDDGNMVKARSIMVGLANMSIETAKDAFKYIQSIGCDVFEEHDKYHYPINDNVTDWNDNYWNCLTSDLMNNFSKERFEHALLVVEYLRQQSSRFAPNKSKKRLETLVYVIIIAGVAVAIPITLWFILKP